MQQFTFYNLGSPIFLNQNFTYLHIYIYNILLSKNLILQRHHMSTLHTINSVKIPFKMLCGKDEGAAENSKNPSKVETKYLPKPRMECQRAESLYTE